jgi:carboxymethylenebutenolidase
MSIDTAEKDLAAAVSYLKKHAGNSTGKVGTVGFCMGGALSLYAATKNKDVSACVVFYGGHPKVQPDLPALKSPVLGIYAERDGFVAVDSVRDLEKKLRGLAKECEIHIYPKCDHGFFNDERPEVYNKEAAQDAWRRTLDFFRKYLS